MSEVKWMCEECGAVFDTPKIRSECVGEAWGSPAYRDYGVCPGCGSEYYEAAMQCPACGEWHLGDHEYCDECVDECSKMLGDIEHKMIIDGEQLKELIAIVYEW